MLKYRKSGRILDEALLKLFVGDAEEIDALDEGDDAPYPARHYREQNGEQSGSHLIHIKIVHPYAAEKECQQRGYAATLAFGAGSVEGIIRVAILPVRLLRVRRRDICSGIAEVIATVRAEIGEVGCRRTTLGTYFVHTANLRNFLI